jgi:ornithine--oxo-acid transaminase
MKQLKQINSKLIKDIRGRGLWVGIEVDKKYASARNVCERLMANGLLTKETHETVVRLAPPLVITKDILDSAIEIIIKTLGEVEASL